MKLGWQCPVCGKINSPDIKVCPCSTSDACPKGGKHTYLINNPSGIMETCTKCGKTRRRRSGSDKGQIIRF